MALTAPGRVNLIGEHTDYHDGFVLPVALPLETRVETTPRLEGFRVVALDLGETAEPGESVPAWARYVLGVAAILEERGIRIPPLELRCTSTIPRGAGLGSSAALAVASGRAFLEAAGASMDPVDLARACQEAEHRFSGTRCGIMDPYVSSCGRVGEALLLDCRTLEAQPVPVPASLLIVDSMVRHSLASGEYNVRREQGEAGVAVIRRHRPNVKALRDLSPEQLEPHREDMEDVIYRRCRHVVTENRRTVEAARALVAGDLGRLGPLMAASHASLRDAYEVSTRELDLLVELAAATPGVYGARMTGAGFGGCIVALVETSQSGTAASRLVEGFRERTGVTPDHWIVP